MAFADSWAALQASLQAGATIQNWTAFKGLVGDSFEIEEVGRNVIVVNTPGATTLQSVRRSDFEAVYEMWGDYVRGTIQRSAFTPITRYSKYVISILHWLEERSGGRLP
jgi:hypothetical protein